MIKVTVAAIAICGALTGAAYFYLPDSQPPTTAASQHQQPPPPNSGNGRERYQVESQPVETFIPLGILAVVIMGVKTVSE